MDEFSMIFIVEGKTDKQKLRQVVPEEAIILCTNGYIDEEALLDLLEPFEMYDFVTLFDADDNGDFYRKIMNRIYPEAYQIKIPALYKEVAKTPSHILLKEIQNYLNNR